MVEIIKNALKNALDEYSEKLEKELTEKYKEEYEKKLRDYRGRLVLNLCESIKIEEQKEGIDGKHHIHITI